MFGGTFEGTAVRGVDPQRHSGGRRFKDPAFSNNVLMVAQLVQSVGLWNRRLRVQAPSITPKQMVPSSRGQDHRLSIC